MVPQIPTAGYVKELWLWSTFQERAFWNFQMLTDTIWINLLKSEFIAPLNKFA